ncbi:MAG: beta-ketoacyl-[acyl-carrier-protein] synthase family protein [Gemmataceae bacterium]
MPASPRRVVLTGLSTLTPLGVDPDTLFRRLLAGESGVRAITAFDTASVPAKIAGEITGFDAKTYITDKGHRRAIKMMSRPIQLAVSAAQAVMNGVDRSKIDPTRFGVEFGAGLMATELPELADAASLSANCKPGVIDLELWGQKGIPAIQPLWMLKYLPNLPAGHISILHDAQGPNNSITESDAASLIALGEAFRILGRDGADVFLVGGCESKIHPVSMVRQSLFEQLSMRNDAPQDACKPFDRDRDGMVVGEGAAVLIVEELGHARRRGATPLAEMVGFGAAFERDHTGDGLARAIAAALRDADVTPADIDFVIGHATGNTKYDAFEARGIAKAFGPGGVPVYAAKGALGNTGAASGTMELAVGVLALRHGLVPPSRNHDAAGDDCPVSVIRSEPKKVAKPHFLKLAYTQLGQCAAAVISEYKG